MKLNAQSWFVRKYLKIEYAHHLPKSACDLVWKFFKQTFFYFWLTFIVAFFTFATIGGIVDAIRFFFFDLPAKQAALLPIFFIECGALVGLAFIVGKQRVTRYYNDKRREKDLLPVEAQPHTGWDSFKELVVAVKDRIKNKTCAIIEYDGLPSNNDYGHL